jgi:sodium/proline symporter
MDNQSQILIIMAVYMVLLIIYGLYQGRKVKSDKDYSIAGRNLPGWVAAFSERATGESSWALLGLPGAAYATGLVEIWTAIGCVLGIICAWTLLAWRLRDEAEKYDVGTFTDYISKRHGDKGIWIRIIGSFTIVFFFFFYIGAQFIGGAKTMYSLFEIEHLAGMLLIAVVVIPYTIYGGFRSVAYTDVIQALIMLVTLIVGPVVALIYLSQNPDQNFFAQNMTDAIYRAGESYSSLLGGQKGFAAGLMVATGFSWFFGYLGGQPQLTLRFMAIKDVKQAKIARNIGVVWTILAYIGALALGWIGIAMFGPQGLDDQEYVMPMVISAIFPPFITGILITGVVAAIVSTANSLLITSATELSDNLIKPFFNNAFFQNHALLLSRYITTILAAIALIVTFFLPSQLIFTIVGYVWAGIGCTFSIVILFSLFWKKYGGTSALITIITGLTFTVFWIASGMDTIISARIMNFLVCAFVAFVASCIFEKKDCPQGKK